MDREAYVKSWELAVHTVNPILRKWKTDAKIEDLQRLIEVWQTYFYKKITEPKP
jgi:hypothetical protein